MKDRKHIIKASIIVLTFIFAISSKAQVPAFTSAEGFGKFATGGRGGQVVFVTTTEDYATGETPIEGSLRWALSTSGRTYHRYFQNFRNHKIKRRAEVCSKRLYFSRANCTRRRYLYTRSKSQSRRIKKRHHTSPSFSNRTER